MPKILDRLIFQLKNKGFSDKSAHAIAISQLQKAGNLKKGSTEATKKGVERGNMTASERAKDRAVSSSKGKHKLGDYKYNQLNNTARLKKK